jgi:hypothetical protein
LKRGRLTGALGEGGNLRLVVLWLRRLVISLLGVLVVWFILFAFRSPTAVRRGLSRSQSLTRLPTRLVILPRALCVSLKILKRMNADRNPFLLDQAQQSGDCSAAGW